VHTSLVLLVACWVGLGYFMLMRHIAGSIGREAIQAYWDAFRGRTAAAAHQHAMPHPSAVPQDARQVTRRGLQLAFYEVAAGWAGFLGMGWLLSGRGFIGVMVLSVWAGIYWTTLFILLAVTAVGPIGIAVTAILWIGLPLLSAIAVYRTYISGAREILAQRGTVG
jgi:hypothetical protein